MYISFDEQKESPMPFSSELAQGSPLLSLLYILYVSSLSTQATLPPSSHEGITVYVDDEVIIQGSKSQKFSQRCL